MYKVIIISIVFLAVSIVSNSQTNKAFRDSITNRLAGNWYWVGTSGGLGGGGYGGPKENGYTTQIKLEKTNQGDSLKFTIYRNNVIQRTGNAYFSIDPTLLNTYRINNIMPYEHSDIMSPPEVDYEMQFQFINKDSIIFLNNGWADSYAYIYRRNPCKECDTQNFISENKLWRYTSKIYVEPCCRLANTALKFKGDSIVNDTIYNKLYSSEDESLLNWKLYGLWRETIDKKVYSRHLFRQIEELMYDFSFIEGDTLNAGFVTFQVDSVLTKLWGGKMRKHWYLNPVHAEEDTVKEWYKTLWVEDVGQIEYFPFNVSGALGATTNLLCFQENGQQVYQNPEYNTCFFTTINDIPNRDKGFKVYPNPVSVELFIQPTSNFEESYTLEIYSVKGERVRTECLQMGSIRQQISMSSFQNGIYILRLISDSGKYGEEIIVKE